MTDWPLDWQGLVDEAVRRRKEEGHTQKSLAALAGVSVPTVNAFEQGEIKLRLEKVFHILEALGMVVLPSAPGSFAAFVRAARQRWSQLVAPLPAGHPSRQPLGRVSYAYSIDGVETGLSLGSLRTVLAGLPSTSGWPPFWVPNGEGTRPVIRDGLIECWIGNPDAERLLTEPAFSDFWQVSGDLQTYLQRGFNEDGNSNLEPGTIFDVALPIWRTAELFGQLLHFAKALELDPDQRFRFESRYDGLEGRQLVAWAAPLRRGGLREGSRSRTASVNLTVETSFAGLHANFDDVVHQALAPLYDLFDGFEATPQFVTSEIGEFHNAMVRLGHNPMPATL